jgi:hypothetical protein
LITLTITTPEGEVERTIDPDALTLGFFEDLEAAQESGKWRDLIPAFASLLELDRATVRHLSVAQFRQIGEALKQAGSVPNESAPLSA